MNAKKILLFICIFLIVYNNIIGQISSFEKIEYASFDAISQKSKHTDPIRIGLYYSIDKTGLLTIRNDDDYHNTLTFNTYQLSSTQSEKINSIFNPAKHLKKYVIKRKLDDDEYFQGTYKYISIAYKNRTKDSLCFIVPFMSNDFQLIYHLLDSVYWADKKRLKKIQPFLIPQYFKNSVLSNYKKSKLPKKKPLPPFRLEDQQ
jgi:hypothetical protein